MTKWSLFLFFVIYFHCNILIVNSEFNFEQIKSDIFLRSDANISHLIGFDDIIERIECMKSLSDIGIGLRKQKQWAIEIQDAWGKMPSGILNGNFYELGEFSQCLNIERNGSKFETQYCLGQLVFDTGDSLMKPKSLEDTTHEWIIPNLLQLKDDSPINPRMAVTVSSPNEMAITFGMCLPESCRLDIFQPIIEKALENYKNVSIRFPPGTCQIEETPSQLKLLDMFMICLLCFFACLIAASTCYDIVLTLINRKKSRALLTFSIYANGMKLLSYEKSKSPDMMHCLHGIRAISTQWVVLGHTFIMYLMLPIRNKSAFLTFISEYHNMVLMSAPISVDTFFVMSGILASIGILKHLEKTNGKINIPLLYVHRYLRLTPLLAVSFLFSMSLLRFFGSGPFWPGAMESSVSSCETYWWSTLLYVQNYVNPKEICFAHSWYLSVDMQLFLCSPFIVYLIYRFRMKILPVFILLILGCIGCTLEVHRKYELKSLMTSSKMDKAYFPTHIRYSPWLIGVIGGYFLFESRKRTIRIPKILNIFCWIVSLAIMTAVIFVNYPLQQITSKYSPLSYGLYDALTRVGWAIALCYIIFACVHNSGGPVNWFLSHPLWQPLSRLSYSIYLVHFPVIIVIIAPMKTTPYFTELAAFHTFIGAYVLTVFVAIIATLAFESPIVIIEKFIFGQPKRHENADKTTHLNGDAIPRENHSEIKATSTEVNESV